LHSDPGVRSEDQLSDLIEGGGQGDEKRKAWALTSQVLTIGRGRSPGKAKIFCKSRKVPIKLGIPIWDRGERKKDLEKMSWDKSIALKKSDNL